MPTERQTTPAPHFFNTLSGQVEEFHPGEDRLVRMYSCGPTVYDYGHIGNFRTFVFVDILRRFLKQSGYRLQHVMNITDVDDKIIRNAGKQGMPIQQYTAKYEKAFLEDMETLNLERPEKLVRATEHIPEMAEFIAELVEKGYAYRADDGSYYFRIAKFPGYGKLSKKDFEGMEDGARVDVDEYEKDSARDFALWKAPKPEEANWDTKIGPGRPGWHIECSVMAREFLGDTLDIHLGGEDLVFPHHENEIAQSEALTGKPFSRMWMHVRFLLVEGEKMSKKIGNVYTVRDLMLKGYKPSSIRYLLASVPYRKQLNFTFDGLRSAASSVERLRNFKLRLETANFEPGTNPEIATAARTASEQMTAALADDLNTAEAMAATFEMVREVNAAADAGKVRKGDVPLLLDALKQFDEIFDVISDGDNEKMQRAREWAKQEGKAGATVTEPAHALSDAEVEKLIEERNQAKRARDFKRSDAIRAQLTSAGVVVEDTKDGVRWKRA
ncbi:MAG: cysteine--tRNA ligase [Acidobacteria bacterium]|nr:cysteine--tRNA ligase [Acidobacteriota bacterium]